MAGQIKNLIDRIVERRAKGDPLVIHATQAKLIFKGINPARFDTNSPDDPALIARLKAIAAEFRIDL